MKKVIQDLEKYGFVQTYDKYPKDEEGQEEYERAIKTHEMME
jgi:hypothetical protein